MAYKRWISALESKLLPQILVGFGAILLILQNGALFAWTSPFLARLQAPDSPLPIDNDQASWIASLLNLGRLLGAVLGALSSQRLGNRLAVCLTFVPIILGWAASGLAISPWWLYSARVLFGVGIGMMFCCFPMYVGEVALPAHRGAIVTVAFIGSSISSVVTSCLGAYLSLGAFSLCYSAPALLGLLVFLWLPDAPQHRLRRGDLPGAEECLRWYRGEREVGKELEDTRQYLESAGERGLLETLREFRAGHVRRALLLCIMLYVFMQASGSNTLQFYMEKILVRAEFRLFEPHLAVVLTGVVAVGFVGASVVVVDRCGRRFLLVLSSLGIALAMACLGTHFLILEHRAALGVSAEQLQLLPISAVLCYQGAYAMGFFTVPSIVQGEILPANVKNVASCIAVIASGIFGFTVSYSYQTLVDLFSEAYVFYGHAVVALLATPFVLIWLPETKGKTLNQIQQRLTGKSRG